MAVIEARALRKEFVRARGGRTVALAGLDLSVPEGGVFGFLGPNGSGKTTTIRCLLGLVYEDPAHRWIQEAPNVREGDSGHDLLVGERIPNPSAT